MAETLNTTKHSRNVHIFCPFRVLFIAKHVVQSHFNITVYRGIVPLSILFFGVDIPLESTTIVQCTHTVHTSTYTVHTSVQVSNEQLRTEYEMCQVSISGLYFYCELA